MAQSCPAVGLCSPAQELTHSQGDTESSLLHTPVTSKGFYSNVCQIQGQAEWSLVGPSCCLELGARVDMERLLVNILPVAVENANPGLVMLHKAWNH